MGPQSASKEGSIRFTRPGLRQAYRTARNMSETKLSVPDESLLAKLVLPEVMFRISVLDQLETPRFRFAGHTRNAVLQLSGKLL